MAKKNVVKYGSCQNNECMNYGMSMPIPEDGNCPICHKPMKPESDDLDISGTGLDNLGSDNDTHIGKESKGPNKKLIVFVVAAVAILCAVGFGIWKLVSGPNPEDYKISIDPKEVTLQAGDTIRLIPAIDQDDAQITFTWESDDSMTVIISEDGLASAIRIGQAAIILHIKEASTPSDTCWITVIENDSTIAARRDSIMKAMQDSITAVLADSLSTRSKLEGDSIAQIISDSIIKMKMDSIAKAQKQKNRTRVTSKTKDLGYATFKGSWPNDVSGRMIFKTSHEIDSKDPKKRVADAGDYIIGEWSEGHLVQGIWYGADNQVKGSVIIGK